MLTDYRRTAERLGAERTLAIATSAVRDAENGEAFLGEVEWSYGFATRLLSGDDEALLTFRGVTSERELETETVIVDIGGGSTELVVGGPDGVRWHDSLDIGSVRLTERFLARPTRPRGRSSSACAAAVRALLAERVPDEIRGGDASRDRRRRDDHDARRARPRPGRVRPRARARPRARRRTRSTSSSTGSPRCRWPSGAACRPLEPERAPVIVAGARHRARGAALFGARPRSRPASATSSTVPRSQPPSCRSRRRAPRRRAPTPAARSLGLGRRLVLGETALQHGPREDPDEPAVLDDGHALEVVLLERVERLLQVHRRVEREERRLGDLAHRRRARVEPGRDDLLHERLARDDADELAVVADEHRAHRGIATAARPPPARSRSPRARPGSGTIASRTC